MEKILIIQTAFIGDAILTLPMIQKLKEFFPSSLIHVIAIPSTAEIFLSSPVVNDVLVIDKKGKHKSLLSLIRFINTIKQNGYTKIYSPHRSFRSSFIVLMLGAKESYGFSNSSFKTVYKKTAEYVPSHHEVRRNLDLIGFDSNEDSWKMLPQIKPSEIAVEKVSRFISSLKNDKKFVAIAPGSVWNTKVYPKEYFEKLIEYFIGKNFYTLLIGGEKDKVICEEFEQKFWGNASSAAGSFSITETIELLKHVELLVSNDSSPSHMAMCADIPAITIYCSTVPRFGFFPYNNKSKFISYDNLNCKPCGIHGHKKCPVNTFDCGWKLTPEEVVSKIKDMLNA